MHVEDGRLLASDVECERPYGSAFGLSVIDGLQVTRTCDPRPLLPTTRQRGDVRSPPGREPRDLDVPILGERRSQVGEVAVVKEAGDKPRCRATAEALDLLPASIRRRQASDEVEDAGEGCRPRRDHEGTVTVLDLERRN